MSTRDQLPDRSACAVVADEIRARGPKDGTEALALSFLDLLAERDRLQAENERYREAMDDAIKSLSWTQCPYYKDEQTCVTGCHQEPICQTDQPIGGWEFEALKVLAAALEGASDDSDPTPEEGR